MPIPATWINVSTAIALGGGTVLTPQEPLDFAYLAPGTSPLPSSTWLAAIGDMNGDGLSENLTGVPGSSVQHAGAGRVYLTWSGFGSDKIGNSTYTLALDGGTADDLVGFSVAGSRCGFVITGQAAGDHAGQVFAAIADLNGNAGADTLQGGAEADTLAGGAAAVQLAIIATRPVLAASDVLVIA